MTINGSCLCGAVTLEIDGELAPATACHCSQCRKQSGHYWVATHILRNALRITRDDGLRWYSASAIARRGFCVTCGSSLFWDPVNDDRISVSMGILAMPTGGRLHKHIFVADKGDYYDIADGLPQNLT